MQSLKDKITSQGRVMPGNILNVGSFLNQQVDIELYEKIGQEFHKRFSNEKITRILTIEASGIGIACMTARYFNVPVVFARKFKAKNVDDNLYSTHITSYTHGIDYTITVPRSFLKADDSVLLINDFLAN